MSIRLLMMVCLVCWSSFSWGADEVADQYRLARQALERGAWSEVLSQLGTSQAIEARLLRGEAILAQGDTEGALREHEGAWAQVQANRETTPRAVKVWAAQTLAETLFTQRQYADANARLTDAFAEAEGAERGWLTLLQGQLEAAQSRPDAARTLLISAQAQGVGAKLKALIAQAQIALCDLDTPPTRQALEAAAQTARQVDPTFARAELFIEIARRASSDEVSADYRAFAQALMTEAAPWITQPHQQVEWQSVQAELFEKAGRFREAQALSDSVIAQVPQASEILFQEEWRRGRLYRVLGDPGRALSAYQRAAFHLKAIRPNIPVIYHAGRSSFRDTLSPFYLGLADLLLQQAATLENEAAQSLLREARDTVEELKAAELQDYLQDSCLIETQSIANLEAIAPRTAVLYPILLPDRLALLLGIGEQQYQTSLPIKADEIREQAEVLSKELRMAESGVLGNPEPLARQIYRWLISPIESWLTKHGVETLVFVPDGPLRLFPLGVLMKDETHLIERYAIVTAPGLTLFDPQPIGRSRMDALVAGMSRPGPVIDELPENLLAGLMGETTESPEETAQSPEDVTETRKSPPDKRSLRGVNLKLRGKPTRNFRDILKHPESRQKIQDLLSLPGVEKEVKAVIEKLTGTLIVNQDFVLDHFKDEMNHPIRIAHIASHGFFGGSSDDSFVMTYDRILKMGQLETLIQSDKTQPLELISLSACQTAEGNDRAPLGLSGVAIKAGARSAIGSLWPVSDEATQILIDEFYHQLRDPRKIKAAALRDAQIKVLRNDKFNHPFFWSPFILIGNWL